MPMIYVDGNAPSSGNGSALAPFRTIQEAVAASQPFSLIAVTAAAVPYDSPDNEPIRFVNPLDITCEPGTEISAEFFVSGGARLEIRNAHFTPRLRPALDDDAPFAQRGTIMASPSQVWLTDCTANGSESSKPLAYAYGSSTLFIRARSKSCTYEFRGSQQTVFAGWYGSYISPRGQDGNKLTIASDCDGPIISIEGSHGYLTDTEVLGSGVTKGTGVVLLRGGTCVFSSSGIAGNIPRGRFRNVKVGIAASRKSKGHLEPSVTFDSVGTSIVNSTGSDVAVI